MKTIILNGNPATGRPDFNGYLDRLLDTLLRQSQEARIFNLAEMKLHYCTGCWTCWWKTPGKCVFRDDMDLVLTEIAGADRLVFASPLSMGFVHSTPKAGDGPDDSAVAAICGSLSRRVPSLFAL